MRLFSKINAILFVCAVLAFAQYALAGNAPEGLLVDLLRDTDAVWRDGYPTQLKIDQLADVVERVQYAEIRSSKPTFSWIVPSLEKNAVQTAWQIQLADSRKAFEERRQGGVPLGFRKGSVRAVVVCKIRR